MRAARAQKGTDCYLVVLAGKHGGKVATTDEALAATYPDICELI
jgi:predicted nucleic acid-binding protein